MNVNEYKGWRSTRFQLTIVCMIMATIGFGLGKVQSAEWLDFLMYIVGIYGSTEVGAKGAVAFKERKG